MTARSLRVKKSILAAAKTSGSGGSQRSSAPLKPPVTSGPKSYGKSNSGKHVVVARFYVTRHQGRSLREWLKARDRWWVIDFKEGDVAQGTEEKGYPSKREAVIAAKEVRDSAKVRYARSPF